MPNAATQVGGWLAGQAGGSAFSASTGGIWNGVQLWANSHVATGIIPYPSVAYLALNGYIGNQLFKQLGKSNGMTGDYYESQGYQHSAWDGQKSDFIGMGAPGGGVAGQAHVNDVSLWATKPIPSIDQASFLFNRELISERLYDHYLQLNTMNEPGTMRAWKEARFEIPGPSDLIHFAVKDAFSPDVVETFGYHKELPTAILPWMRKQGYGGNVGIDIPPGATTTSGVDIRRQAQWFDLYWWAHWTLVSPTQAAEMLHRMYISSDYGPAPGVTRENHFTIQQYRTLLKASDYPEFWRNKLEFISYSPLTRVDVRRMYDLNVIGDAEVYHAYRAIGYDDINAKHLLKFTQHLRTEKRIAPTRNKLVAEIREMWMMEIINDNEAKQNLLALNIHETTVASMIKLWQMQHDKEQIKDIIKIIKAGRMNGNFSIEMAERALRNLGLSFQVASNYNKRWTYELEAKRKHLSANTIQEHAIMGLITRNVMIYKLQNLNFRNDEIDAMVEYVLAKRQEIFMRNYEKQLKAIFAEKEKERKMLIAPYTDANIKAMFKKGAISMKEVYQTLSLRNWKQSAIVDWITTYLEPEFTEEQAEEFEEEETEEEEETSVSEGEG